MMSTHGELRVLDALIEMYEGRSGRPYGGSRVDQRLHAVQAGWLARERGGTPSFVVAALLHDIGHMVRRDLGGHPVAQDVDDDHDDHEQVGATWLARVFGPAVAEPVRLHSAARRHPCATQRGCPGGLARDAGRCSASKIEPMSVDEARRFERLAHWRDAVALSRIDESARDPRGPCPAFGEFRHEVVAALRGAGRSAPAWGRSTT
jgi:predicted HD phosphohydrolase